MNLWVRSRRTNTLAEEKHQQTDVWHGCKCRHTNKYTRAVLQRWLREKSFPQKRRKLNTKTAWIRAEDHPRSWPLRLRKVQMCGKMHWFAQVKHSRANFIERVLKDGLKNWALFSCTHCFGYTGCTSVCDWSCHSSIPIEFGVGGDQILGCERLGEGHTKHGWSDLTNSFFVLSAKGVSAAKTWQAGVQL